MFPIPNPHSRLAAGPGEPFDILTALVFSLQEQLVLVHRFRGFISLTLSNSASWSNDQKLRNHLQKHLDFRVQGKADHVHSGLGWVFTLGALPQVGHDTPSH